MIRDNPDYFQWASARVPDGLDKGAILYLIARESSVPHVAECDPARSSATYSVSNGLDALAEQHPLVSEGLITISESVRNTATLLGVLVATKTGCSSGQIQQVSNLLSAVCGGFVWDTHLGDYNLRLTFLH